MQLYKAEEVWESKAALMDLPKDAVLAVVPNPNHPAMFWGANVAMGYPGHLWTHAIDYGERERRQERIFKGKAPITVSVSDGHGSEILQSFTLEITPEKK